MAGSSQQIVQNPLTSTPGPARNNPRSNYSSIIDRDFDFNLSDNDKEQVGDTSTYQIQANWPDDNCTPRLDHLTRYSTLDEYPFSSENRYQSKLSTRSGITKILTDHSSNISEESDDRSDKIFIIRASREKQQHARDSSNSRTKKERPTKSNQAYSHKRSYHQDQNDYLSQFTDNSSRNPYNSNNEEGFYTRKLSHHRPVEIDENDFCIIDRNKNSDWWLQRRPQNQFLESRSEGKSSQTASLSINSDARSYKSQGFRNETSYIPLRRRDRSRKNRFGLNKHRNKQISNPNGSVKSCFEFDFTELPDSTDSATSIPVRKIQKKRKPEVICLLDSPEAPVRTSMRNTKITIEKEVISPICSPELVAARASAPELQDKDDPVFDSPNQITDQQVQDLNDNHARVFMSDYDDVDTDTPTNIQDIFMKDKIKSAKRLQSRNSRKRNASEIEQSSRKPAPKKQKLAVHNTIMTAEQRNQHTAEYVINQEVRRAKEIQEVELFEDIGENESEKAARLEMECAEAQLWREQRAAESFIELERKQLQEESIDKFKIAKEREEERNNIRTDAERSQQAALDAIEREECRQEAQEETEAHRRQEAAKKAEAREKEEQSVREKLANLQTKAEELAKFKTKQEEAERQAASITSKKVLAKTSVESFKEVGKFYLDNLTEGDDTDSLFLPRTPPHHFRDAIIRKELRAKSTSPGLFVRSNETSPVLIPRNLNSEKAPPDIYVTAKQCWVDCRAAKEQSTEQSARNEERPVEPCIPPSLILNEQPKKLSQTVEQVAQPAEPYTSSVIIERPETSQEVAEQILQKAAHRAVQHSILSSTKEIISQPISTKNDHPQSKAQPEEQINPEPRIPNQNILPSATSITQISIPQWKVHDSSPDKIKHTVQVISDFEREKIEREAKEKRANQKAELKRIKSQKAKAETQKKMDEKAREKKRQELMNNAFEKDIPITEDELDVKVEEFMKKREEFNARRRGKGHNRTSNSADSSQDSAAKNRSSAPITSTSLSRPFMFEDDVPDDEIIPILTHFNRRVAEERKSMNQAREASRAERGVAFRRTAAITNIGQLQPTAYSSEESEEDPDPEPLTTATNPSVNSFPVAATSGIEQLILSSDESDSDESTATVKRITGNVDTDHHAQFTNYSFFKSQDTSNSLSTNKITLPEMNPSNPSIVHVYEVKINRYLNDQEPETMNVESFNSIEEANTCVNDQANHYKKEIATRYMVLETDTNTGLVQAQLDHHPDELGSMLIYITRTPTASSIYTPEFLASIPKAIPPKYWVVVKNTVVEMTMPDGRSSLYDKSEIIDQYTSREMANSFACMTLADLTKPKSPKIIWVQEHERFVKMWRELRQEHDDKGTVFDHEIESQEKSFEWLQYVKVRVKVEKKEFTLRGPLN